MNETTFRDVASEPQAATHSIAEENFYAPTTRDFLTALDNDSNPSANKIFPPLVFTDFIEFKGSADVAIKRNGILAAWTPKTFLTILDGWKPPEDVLAQLRELQTRYEALVAEYEKYSNRKAEQDWKNQRGNEVQKRAHNQPVDAPNRSLGEFKFDYQTKRQAVDDSIRPITRQAAELAAPIIKSALNSVRVSMIIFEEQERAQAACQDLPWYPSLFWKCHASILIRLTGATTIEKLYQSACARNMLAGIVEL